ncbi:MAG: InlB B-repeat-containing protein [Oscillospiraceae bacterium]|nr:InlB B-repeat-containing protein [Oscillospiraceae bacterium]
MKKIVQRLSLGFLFCLALCLCFAPAGYAEAELVDAGSCGASGANVSWMLFSDGELTITGTGDMRSCYRSQPWAAYSDEIRAVTIGSGVTRIGMDAFSGCKNLRTVSIPNSVTAIDTLAFTGSGLTEVTIPGSVTSIPSEVFKNCKSLKTARLNYGVATIGSYAFSSSGLTSVTIPGSVTTIGANAFYQSSLNEVTIPGSVETIGKGAFSSTKLTSVTINSGVTSIGSQAFEYCYHLTSVSIPNTVTQIGDNAFHSCDSLSSITIPGSVESIGSQAFYFCKSLKNVTVPASVTSIGTNAFGACDGITSAGPIGGAYDYQFGWNNAIPDNAFQFCRMLKSITIPNSVNSIDERAFYNCPELESLTIPTSMRSIGVNAFYGCSSLHHVYYNSTQAKWNQITVESGNTALQNATLHLSSQPPATYTVSYSADGGNGIPESQIKEYGTALTLSTAVPTRENDEADSFTVILDANGGTVSPTSMTAARSNTYSFNSWNTDEQGMRASYAPGASYTAEADAVLYAQWNYGIITESLNLPTPTHEKYNFLGWGTDSDAIEGITGEYVPKGNVTLYAVWDIETYDVTYDANGGTNAPSAQRKKQDIDLVLRSDLPERAASTDQPYVITLNANGGSVTPNTLTPTRTTSYTFRTWNTEQDGSGTSYSPGSSFSDNAALTLYAQWDSEASIESVELPELSRAGYSFLGWGSSSDAASGITGSYTPTADVTLYAIWKPDRYAVTYNANGGTDAPKPQIKLHGSALTLSSAEPTHESTEVGSYTVTLDAKGGTVSTSSLTAARTKNYTFHIWNTASNGSGTDYAPGASYTGNAPLTLYAMWKTNTNTSAVTLPVPTREGYIFKGWSAQATASSGITGSYTPTESKTLYAIWRPNSGTCGNNLTWTLDGEGTLIISGSGSMSTNSSNWRDDWRNYKADIRSAIINEGVTSVGQYAFADCSSLSDISLPESLQNIGSYAFNNCSSLRTITIPESVQAIGSYAFYNTGINSVVLPEGITSINTCTFKSCSSLSSVTIPRSVNTIAGYAFYLVSDHLTVYYNGTEAEWNQISVDEGNELGNADKYYTYTIDYQANGGFGAPDRQKKITGEAVTLSNATPSHENSVGSYTVRLNYDGDGSSSVPLTSTVTTTYSFSSWNTQQDGHGTSYAPGSRYTANANLTLYAQWNSSTSIAEVTLPAPTRTGYSFMGWALDSSASSGVVGSYTPDGNVTLYAIWKPDTYTISYDANGGVGAPANQTKTHDIALTLSAAVPTRDNSSAGSYTVTLDANGGSVNTTSLTARRTTGYTFKNWNTAINGSGTNYAPGAEYTANIAAVLYAQWNSSTSTAEVTLPTPTRPGYTFKGWAGDSSAGSGVTGSYRPTGDVTLYATWEINTYFVSYNANGGSGAPANQIKTHGITLNLSAKVPTRTNSSAGGYTVTLNPNGGSVNTSSLTAERTTSYTFRNWNTAINGSGTSYEPGAGYTANVDLILYAQWNSITSIAEVTLPTPTRTGYSFMGWAPDSSASSGVVASYTPGGNVTLYAIWKPNTYTISYDANGGVGAPANQTKTQDIALTLSAAVPTRDNSSAGSYTVTLDANGGSVNPTSLTAKRTTGYTFRNWNTAINGSGTSYAPGARYTANASAVLYAQWNSSTTASPVTLPTPTRSGYSFMGWSSNSSASSGSVGSYTPGANVTLYAIWKPDTYIISYNANGGTGTPSSQIKEQDVPLTLSSVQPKKYYIIQYNAAGGTVSPASKNVNCTFDNWNSAVNGSGTSYASGGTYTINADATLYAQWTNPTAGTLAAPKRSGYVFDGWFTSATSGVRVTDSSTITGNMTVYAHWTESAANPYNLGEETYSFENYGDSDSAGGHCFGMSMTSAGYYNGLLDISRIGGNAGTPLYSFSPTSTVKKPICYYQSVQGSYSRDAIVAGGSFYLYRYNNIASDWREVVNYVSNHEYDGTGLLQIGFRKGLGGHAINFLRYENVNGQDRIYAYDNNFPTRETYFYQDSGGNVRQAPVQTFSGSIDCIALRDCRKYFNSTGDFDSTHALYMAKNAATVEGYSYTYMEGEFSEEEYVMYEIPADQDRVIIVPNRDYADFIYMDTEYSFGVITDETYGELKFASINEHGGTSDAVFRVFESDSGFAEPDFVLPSALTEIEESAFEGISAATVYIPDLCTSIGSYAFRNASVKQIRIPEACSIAENAFDGCARVKIFGTPGSPAEVYCDSHENCTFIPENRKVVLEMHVSCASLSPFEE